MTRSPGKPPTVSDSPARIPVVQEDLDVSMRTERIGTVRVRVKARQADQQVDLHAVHHGVTIERRPIGEEVQQRSPPRQEGDVLIVPVYEEQTIVTRRLVLMEELRLRPRSERREWTQQVSVLREEAVIERQNDDGTWTPMQGDVQGDLGSGPQSDSARQTDGGPVPDVHSPTTPGQDPP